MEINLQLEKVGTVDPARAARPVHAPPSRATEDEVAIENTRALRTALESTPFIRQEVVKRAAELVGDVNYPPRETIRMISHLLAIKLNPPDDGPS